MMGGWEGLYGRNLGDCVARCWGRFDDPRADGTGYAGDHKGPPIGINLSREKRQEVG